MRIIGGELGGRVLRPSMKGWPTRPTTDMAREALFNILQHQIDFEECHILELFGGTAAHSIECISRGCKDVTYVDSYAKCVRWTKAIAEELQISESLSIHQSDVRKFIKKASASYDYVFADPPYSLDWMMSLPDLVFGANLIKPKGFLIIEHGSDTQFSHHANFDRSRKYGQSAFSFFKSNATTTD